MFYTTASRSTVELRFWLNEVTPLVCQNCSKPASVISFGVGCKFSLTNSCSFSGVLPKCNFA